MCSLDGFASALKNDLSSTDPSPWADRLLERHNKRFEKDDLALKLKAYGAFLKLNEEVHTDVDLPPDVLYDARHFIRTALERATLRNAVSPGVQCCFDLHLALSLWRFGPGASVGTRNTHFVDKVNESTLTCTKRALPFVKLLRSLCPRLSLQDAADEPLYTTVNGSRLSAVAKNQETSRTIGIEPLWNMALQLGAGAYIECALRSVGLDISTQQEKNKELARVGSVTGKLATIDLKSASDMISPALIKTLWPVEWYSYLSAIRSESITVDLMGHTKEVKLNMMSTMGNGFTFPMMTLTLLALVYAVMSKHCNRSMHWDPTKVAVYGDDIICPIEYYESISNVLSLSGLIVNHDKSFHEGPFRESCGGDFYNGMDITPFYVRSLSTDPEIYVAINQALDWGAKTGVILSQTLSFLMSLIEHELCLVPQWESPDSGVLTEAVSSSYVMWQPVQRQKVWESRNANLDFLCCVGGYVTSRPATGRKGKRRAKRYSCFYVIRSQKSGYRLAKVTMPHGYSNGRDWGNTQSELNYFREFIIKFAIL